MKNLPKVSGAKSAFVLIVLLFLFKSVNAQDVKLRQDQFLTVEQGKQELADFAKTFSNKAEWAKRAENVRKNILIGAELSPMPKKCPLKPIISEKRTYDGYTVENVAFESLPGFFVTGNLYRPTKKFDSYAAILCPHGHFYPTDTEPMGRFRKDHQLRCAALAKMGAVVFAYDMVGWGESTQFENFKYPQTHESFQKALKYQLLNSIRSVDFLLTLKGVDPKRIGVTGASGGGTQAFLLAAVDKRIAVSCPVVMVSCSFFGGCICESGMPVHQSKNHLTNNCDIAATFAPKPQLLVSDGDDWTKNTPEVEMPYLKNVYGLFGAADKVQNVHLKNDKHDYGITKRVPVYAFMAKYLKLDESQIMGKDKKVDESFVTIEKQDQMLVFTAKNPRPAYAIKAIEKL